MTFAALQGKAAESDSVRSGAFAAVILVAGVLAGTTLLAPSTARAYVVAEQPTVAIWHLAEDAQYEVSFSPTLSVFAGPVALALAATTTDRCRSLSISSPTTTLASKMACAAPAYTYTWWDFSTSSVYLMSGTTYTLAVDVSSASFWVGSASTTDRNPATGVLPEQAFIVLSQGDQATTTPSAPSLVNCSWSDVACNFGNAFLIMFSPSETALGQWYLSVNSATTTFPFSVVFDARNVFVGLFAAATTTFPKMEVHWAAGTTTIMSHDMIVNAPYHDTVRTILASLIVLGGAMVAYRKLLHIHDNVVTQ